MVNYTLHKAEERHYDSIVEIYEKGVQHMLDNGIYQWDEVYPTPELLWNDIQVGQIYVIMDGDRAVAAVVYNEDCDPEYADVPWTIAGEKICYLHRLCVHPETQGRGVGAATVRLLEDHVRQKGYPIIRLDTFSENGPANTLYRKLGYHYAGDVQFRKGLFHCYEKALAAAP